MGVAWGDVPTWFAATGTVGAFAVSLWLLRQNLVDRRLAHANAVAGWLERMELDREPYPALIMRVRNAGDLPVTEVSTRVAVGVRGTFIRYLETLAPRETREFVIYLPAYPRANVIAPDIQFRDVEGRYWERDSNGRLKRHRQYQVYEQDPGAYPESDHPTLHLPESVEEHRGYRVE